MYQYRVLFYYWAVLPYMNMVVPNLFIHSVVGRLFEVFLVVRTFGGDFYE